MTKYLSILLLIQVIVAFFISPVAAEDLKITRISPEGGFTFDAISSISEDNFGFIWFGSSNGVYRYNTIETVKYINIPGDASSLSGNNVRSLYLDLKKELWIATNNGLSVFDYRKEYFRRYSFHDAYGNPKGINVLQVLQTADSSYWMIDDSGFSSLDLEKNLATYLPLPDTNTRESIRMATKAKDNDRIWLGGQSGGIYYCDPPYRKIEFFGRKRVENVYAILPDRDKIWVGYDWGGVDIFDKQGTLLEHMGDEMSGSSRLLSSRVRNIFRNDNEIWIGTFKGLVRVKPDGIEYIDKEQNTGLQSSSIFQIYRDSGNGIWIGTWSGGLSYINAYANSFEHFKRESFDNSLSDNVVSDFEETSDGNVIAATEEGHLNYLDKSSRNFSLARIKGSKGMVFSIKSLYTDKTGTLWIGTFASGIFYQTLGSKTYQHLDQIEDFREQFYDITSAEDGMWFGSSSRGLYYYDFKSRTVKRYYPKSADPESVSSANIRSLLIDSKGDLWVGTMNGLNKKLKNSDKFIRYFYNPNQQNRISSNIIYYLMEDSNHLIWIGTAGGGVNIYDPKTEGFSQLSQKEGLPGNDVYGILEDESGVMWMSTENGISAYDPVRKGFRNFDFSDGLQGNQFNPGSAFKSKSGALFFGGSNGFTRFYPKKIKENPILPKAYITGLEINNLTVSRLSNPELIPQSLLTLDHLELNYNQNSLKFELAANNFLLPQKNCFRYRLMGYSPNWIDIQRENKAVFTKIPPGNYLFEVMAANNDGKWNPTPTRLEITIRNPFWKTIYAFLFYCILLLVVMYLLQRELRLRNRLLNSSIQRLFCDPKKSSCFSTNRSYRNGNSCVTVKLIIEHTKINTKNITLFKRC